MFRKIVSAVALLAAALLQPVFAQDEWPRHPIRFVVGFSAGGSTDVIARLLAKSLSDQLGQPVVVDNRAGAGGGIALQQVANAPADGYTLIMLTGSSTTLQLVRKTPFDVERDFTPVGMVAIGPQVLAVTAFAPIKSVQELLTAAHDHPRTLSYGTSGVGTPSHLAGVMLDEIAGVSTIAVPYKGSAENIVAIAAGDVTMSFADAVSTMPMLQAGKATALGVTTAKRASFLPNVPTLEESGLKGLVLPLWFGVGVPAGTPPAIVAKLHAAIARTVSAPGVKEPFNKLGVDPQGGTPAEFKSFIHGEIEKNARLIKASGIKFE